MKTLTLLLFLGLSCPLLCQIKVKYGLRSVMNTSPEHGATTDVDQLNTNFWGGEGFLRVYKGRLLGVMALGYKHSGKAEMTDASGIHSLEVSQGMTSFTLGAGGRFVARPSMSMALMGGVRPALRSGELEVGGVGRMRRFALAATSYLEVDYRRFTFSAGAVRALTPSYITFETRPGWGVDFGLGYIL